MEGQSRIVQRTNNLARHTAFSLLLGALLLVGCSSGESTDSASTAVPQTPSAVAQSSATATAVEGSQPTPTTVREPVLQDQDVASVVDLSSGEQTADVQGNLIAVYGSYAWSDAFDELSADAQTSFPFFGDVDELADPSRDLVVLDVGMCSAGIDAAGFGTAEFFVHRSNTDVLSTDLVNDRGVLARHPVLQPGFRFPGAAQCTRGWLPVLWTGGEPPAIARYVLTTRESADAAIEQHVYQWDLEPIQASPPQPEDEPFLAGQTVTFNAGPLRETTVTVNGWAELVGVDSPVDGTRLVAVSLAYCPSSLDTPDFGLSVDGWNIVGPVGEPGSLGADSAADPTQQCFDGWLEFVVPFGGVPTGFFASDGVDSSTGYAEWSLVGAALPAP